MYPADEPGALAARFWRLYTPGRSLFSTMHALVWRDVYLSAGLVLISTLASLLIPYILGVLLDAVSAEVKSKREKTRSMLKHQHDGFFTILSPLSVCCMTMITCVLML